MKDHRFSLRVFATAAFGVLVACLTLFLPSHAQQVPPNVLRLCYGVHVRKDAYTLSANEIASLRHGVQVMMSRAATDPTSWRYQANMHGTYDSPTQPLWNGCQHSSYFFFSWHRMYLYYFERILRAASGDPYLTLPYWNYTSPAESAIPLPYRQPADPSNPLYISDRDSTMNAGGLVPPSAASYAIAFGDFNFEATMGASFGGHPSPPTQFDSGAGDLELQPHNVIHCVVGGLMCDPDTAAQDPVFFLHHANIDRLWKRWLDQGGGRANPTSDTAWMNTTFNFFDENGHMVSLSGKDILDTVAQLDYRYDDDPPSWIFWIPRVPVAVERQVSPGAPQQLTVSTPAKVELGTEPSHVELNLSRESSATIDRLMADRETPHSVVLNLEGVEFAGNPGSYYEVYLNLPWPWRNGPPDFHCLYFIGNLSLFVPRVAGHSSHKPGMVSFDLTKLIQTLKQEKAWTGDQLTVTFVLQHPIPPPGAKPRETKSGVQATIEKISVVAK